MGTVFKNIVIHLPILFEILFVIIYLQSEYIEKFELELCSKYDRERNSDVILR